MAALTSRANALFPFQYGTLAFAKFERPECTRLHFNQETSPSESLDFIPMLEGGSMHDRGWVIQFHPTSSCMRRWLTDQTLFITQNAG